MSLFEIWLSRYGNKILVTDELPDGQMVDQWEPVMHDSVKTPLEVQYSWTFHFHRMIYDMSLRGHKFSENRKCLRRFMKNCREKDILLTMKEFPLLMKSLPKNEILKIW